MQPAGRSLSRIWWRRSAGVLLLVLSIAGLWVLAQFRSRENYFRARHGKLATVEAGQVMTEAGGFVSQSARVTADTGLTVDLRVLRPGDSTQRLPLVVLLGGHRTGRDAVDLLGTPGPIAVAALDYPYHGPEKLRGVRQSLASVPTIRRSLLDTPPAISLALDWLVTQPWVDPARVELIGVSLGVPFATVAGAMDTRFRRVWLIHGGEGNRAWIEHNLRAKISFEPARAGAAGLVYLAAHGPSVEAGEWVTRIAPRPVVIIGARNDQRLPPPLVERLHATARDPKELIWTEGGHVDRRPEAVRDLLEIVRGRILSDDPVVAGKN